MKTDQLDWLALHLAVGGSAGAVKLLEYFGSPAAIFAADPAYLAAVLRLTASQIDRLRLDYRRRAQQIRACCLEFGWIILTADDPRYPQRLKALGDYPPVLFADGDPEPLRDLPAAAVVGTRRASPEGRRLAYRLGSIFAGRGVATVSGCAVGIDSAAHEGALAAGGYTVGVLGNGLGYNYLPERSLLRRQISRSGVLLTEMNPFDPPSYKTFPRRNRLLVALGDALVVAESGVDGGSVVSAELAERQKKPIFVPARDICDSPGARMLAERGARVMETADALLTLVAPAPPLKTDPADCRLPETMSEAEYAAYYGRDPRDVAWVRELHRSAAGRRELQRIEGDAVAPRWKAQPVTEKRTLPATASLFTMAEKAAAPETASVPAKEAAAAAPRSADPAERKILDALADGALLPEEIAVKSGLSAADVFASLTTLELEGLVRADAGGFIGRTDLL